jgi:hypothetical protein
VVCIPYDHSQQKMRVCRYKVIGLHNGDLMDNTAYELEPELGSGAEVQPVGDEEDLEVVEGTPIEETPEQTKDKNLGNTPGASPRCKNWPEGATGHDCMECNPEAIAKLNADPAYKWSEDKPKKAPVEKKMKKVREDDKRITLKVVKKYRAIHDKSFRELMDESVADLREYASKVLSIVGASKIVGGKAALVKKIISTRKHFDFI